MQQNGVFDLLKMLELNIDESFPIIPGRFVVVNPKEIETLIDRIYASLPVEVQEARAFLRRRDEMQMEAQQKAEKIRMQAAQDALKTKEGADLFAEKVLTDLEQKLAQQQQLIKNGQIYLEQLRNSSVGDFGSKYENSANTEDYATR